VDDDFNESHASCIGSVQALMVQQYYSARTYEEKREHLVAWNKYSRGEEAFKAQIKKLVYMDKVMDYAIIGVCDGLIVWLVVSIIWWESDGERRNKKMLDDPKEESMKHKEEMNKLRAESKEGLKAYEASLDLKTR
jgi:hypothetical protein